MAKNKTNKPAEQPKTLPERGRVGVIGQEQIAKAYETLKLYQKGKSVLEERVVENEKWYRQRHWEVAGTGTTAAEQAKAQYDPKPVSAWLFNSLANKHADAMDNYPMLNILPQEESDKQESKILSSIMPVIMEKNGFKQTYSDGWWYKLKHGTAVYTVIWNNKLENGLGDIEIKGVDILNVFWQPGIKDIQQGRNFFHAKPVDNDILVEMYPFLEGMVGANSASIKTHDTDDSIDRSEQTWVYDWYYKKQDGTRTILHYCKFIEGAVIYASENDTEPRGELVSIDEMTGEKTTIPLKSMAETGWYEHGRYPFEFDVLFPIEGSPCGFGYVDIMKEPQIYIDKMNQIILKNALMSGKKRWFVKKGIGINTTQFADWSQDFVEVSGTNPLDDGNLKEIQVSTLPSFIANYMQMKIDELKETSGNRDFSQGGTSSGVTAASAIAALQEAGSKLSRDMIQTSYQATNKIGYLQVELVREFYDEARTFRITGETGEEQFAQYDNRNIKEQITIDPMTGEEQARKPIFDIKVVAQRQSPFNRIAQNELAKELYAAGVFEPQRAEQALILLDMMEFEGKDKVVQQVQKNAQMFAMIQQLQMALGNVAGTADIETGSNFSEMVVGQGLVPPEHPIVAQARAQAQSLTDPNGGGE